MIDQEHPFEALLERQVSPPDQHLMLSCIKNKTIMVTGAGGSIGAELCRQLLQFQPLTIILFENSEFALYAVDKALKAQKETQNEAQADNKRLNIVPVLGSITDVALVEKIFQEHQVDTVYHSAAYKQVPMLEQNVIAGIQNNVLGTCELARAAQKYAVSHFIYISTDKAVRPVSVMGATKRFAEQVLQAMSAETSNTCFAIVRFGNVLGSSGSVLPIFHQQILRGGPVTVTHPEVSRYFMTAEEAAQLVIQAGALASGGEVFVLEMGKPIRIADIARKYITLMGYEICENCRPQHCVCERGIRIEYTGLREGEKLSEELFIDNAIYETPHASIFRSKEQYNDWPVLQLLLKQIEKACHKPDSSQARKILFAATQVLTHTGGKQIINPVPLDQIAGLKTG